ncbi:MAG: carboxypeptidase regulatory-like domain-containing protein [Saprospiraceae bacterium]
MRFLFVLLLAPTAAFWMSDSAPSQGQILSGQIRDTADNPVAGAAVEARQGDRMIAATLSDAKGEWTLTLADGRYDLHFSKEGFDCLALLDYPHMKTQASKIAVRLKPEKDVAASERVSFNAGLHLILPDASIRAHRPRRGHLDSVVLFESETYEERVAVISRDDEHGAAVKSESSRPAGAAPSLRKALPASAHKRHMDFARSTERALPDPDALPDPTRAPEPSSVSPAPRAGLLTAGEWNDLHNWGRHWVDLLADGETDQWQKLYGFYPRFRYAVRLSTESGHPVVDAPLALRDADGTILWESRTDNAGRAELWYALYDPERKEASALTLTHTRDGVARPLGQVKDFAGGYVNEFRIDAPCRTPQSADIVWVVDATGSMGDEIEYLKTELLDVIGRVRRQNRDLDLRMGTVFYRDIGDEYLTRSSKLTHRIAETVDFIRKQSAGGGGDTPEAVHSALEEAIYRQPWRDEAVARICFLVLDASPHTEPEVLERLRKTIREAARKGIRIVPLSASGVQKDTEFLMKFFGLATNGTYLFLTDHSGIGGKHLAPTADEYKVEALNDLLVRLISEYTRTENCDGKWAMTVEDRQSQQDGAAWQVLYYPNPASDFFSVELPVAIEALALYDAAGKLVLRRENLSAGTHRIAVRDLPPGQYILRLLKFGYWQGARIAVLR